MFIIKLFRVRAILNKELKKVYRILILILSFYIKYN